MHKTYILQSQKDGTLYIGVTQNLSQRIRQHNNGEAEYSSSKRPFELVWYCAFHDKEKAYDFERYLKSSSGHSFMKKRLL